MEKVRLAGDLELNCDNENKQDGEDTLEEWLPEWFLEWRGQKVRPGNNVDSGLRYEWITFQLLLSTFPVPVPVQGGTGHAEVRDTDPALRNEGKDSEMEKKQPGW